MSRAIYLDHHATTPVDARVLARMLPYFSEHFGNAASPHSFGWRAQEACEAARGEVAGLLGAGPKEILFTSGATESNNLAIQGVARALGSTHRHLVTQASEHPSVLNVCRALEAEGWALTVLPVDGEGRVRLADVAAALTPKTALVSIMLVNNEVGTVQPIGEIAELCRAAAVYLHCDATQGVGVLPVDVETLGVDLLSLSAHKLYGPKGVGALYVRRQGRRVSLVPIAHGGAQEQGLRPGTANVPGIVGLGTAAALLRQERAAEALRLAELRDRLWAEVRDLPGIHRNSPATGCHPGNLHVSVAGVDGEALLLALRPIAVASGAACATGSRKPSHVLAAMGIPPELARGSLRLGLGRGTTAEDIATVAARLREAVAGLRRDPVLAAPGQRPPNG